MSDEKRNGFAIGDQGSQVLVVERGIHVQTGARRVTWLPVGPLRGMIDAALRGLGTWKSSQLKPVVCELRCALSINGEPYLTVPENDHGMFLYFV